MNLARATKGFDGARLLLSCFSRLPCYLYRSSLPLHLFSLLISRGWAVDVLDDLGKSGMSSHLCIVSVHIIFLKIMETLWSRRPLYDDNKL